MGLFSLTFTGATFILTGSYESLSLATSKSQRFSTPTLISVAILSFLFISDAFLSLFDAFTIKDKLGFSLQLQLLAISSLFLLFSFLGLFSNISKTISFPHPLLNLILFFSFIEEFLFFYLRLKDPNGVENRYFQLMLVPISVCVVATMVELKCPDSDTARLGRGLGLILQGTWFVQMGFSFYTDLIANNCALYYKSRGNYTIKCKGHMDYHRGGAIAVLLFNCHLALLLAVVCGVYSCFGRRLVDLSSGDYSRYKRIATDGEMRVPSGVNLSQFTLDSDDDDGRDGIDEIKPEKDGVSVDEFSGENGSVELTVNGFGSNHG